MQDIDKEIGMQGKLATDDEELFINYINKNNDSGVILLKDYDK